MIRPSFVSPNQIIAKGGLSARCIGYSYRTYADRKETAVRFRVDGTCLRMKIPAAYRPGDCISREDHGQP